MAASRCPALTFRPNRIRLQTPTEPKLVSLFVYSVGSDGEPDKLVATSGSYADSPCGVVTPLFRLDPREHGAPAVPALQTVRSHFRVADACRLHRHSFYLPSGRACTVSAVVVCRCTRLFHGRLSLVLAKHSQSDCFLSDISRMPSLRDSSAFASASVLGDIQSFRLTLSDSPLLSPLLPLALVLPLLLLAPRHLCTRVERRRRLEVLDRSGLVERLGGRGGRYGVQEMGYEPGRGESGE